MKILTSKNLLIIFIIFCAFHVKGQTITGPTFENAHYLYNNKTASVTSTVTAGNVTASTPITTAFTNTIVMPSELNIPQRKILNAMFFIKANLGDNYNFGPDRDASLDFKFRISFDLKAYNSSSIVTGIFDQTSYELTLENSKPEAVFVKNFTQFSDLINNSVSASDFIFQRFLIDNVRITPITIAANPSTHADMLAKIANSIKFEISYDIEYGLDVISAQAVPVITPLSSSKQTGKQMTFSWNSNGFEFPNYEFQLLRLYNKSTSTAVTEERITTDLDWSKSLKIETQSSKTSLALTMAEGTGFYVWRVRPLGNYHEGGSANNLNYSESSWSINPGNIKDALLELTAGGISYGGPGANPYLYFEDVDKNKNWIYSRVFTEGNRVTESVSYATTLQQPRQTQSYLPSKDSTVVTQTIQDNSGRSAMSTMSIPVPGNLGIYKNMFVQKAETNELYSANDYDNATNYKQPAKINDIQNPFSYYSNENKNINVPSAEGYAFQRTTFYDDGTDRVKEQSGVGRTNMIGDNTAGKGGGKTTKTFYGTPSATELIQLFGDEAPDHEGVLKTVTVDPNNTASISYTSKEGNIIATGLSFQDGEGTILDALDEGQPSATPSAVTDVITRNMTSEKGFMSSKRIAILQATPLDISYKVKCQDLENNCLDLTLDCKYRVKVVIHNVDNPNATIVLAEMDLSNSVASCVPDGSGINYKSVSWPRQTLSPGTYVIEKILLTGDPAIVIEDARKKAEKQIMPLVNKITGWLQGVDCEAELEVFYTNINNFKNDINNAFAAGTTCNAACVVSRYGLGDFILVKDKHKIDIYNNAGNKPNRMEISSPCCDPMSVSVAYIPPFRCPPSFEPIDKGTNGFDVNMDFFGKPNDTEYFPDLEGYALALLKDCGVTPTNFWTTYMKGWGNKGDFNKMVYHMLQDQYSGKAAHESGDNGFNGNPAPKKEVDDCGNPINNTGIKCDPNNNNLCTHYSCSQLTECWTQQIIALRNTLCANGEYASETPANVSNRTDAEAGEEVGKGKTHDNQFDLGGVKLSRRKKRKLKKKISESMRLASASAQGMGQTRYNGYLVKDFLDCTGYSFAKILTFADPLPLPEDVKSNLKYNVPFTGGTATTSCSPCKRWPYNPSTTWPGIDVIPPDADNPLPKEVKDFFPNIKDPLYAFKYFEYPEAQRKRDIELLSCYSDPNDCYKTDAAGNILPSKEKIPCCFKKNANGTYESTELCDTAVPTPAGNGNFSLTSNPPAYNLRYHVKEFCDKGKVVCPYTVESWSSGQRFTFYKMVNGVVVPPPEEDPVSIDEACEDYTTFKMGDYNETTNIIGLEPFELINWKTWNNIAQSVTIPQNQYPTVVDFDRMKMRKDCEKKCESRRVDFRNKLVLTFTKKGYIIGGCKTTSTDNVVPEEDIDLLVDELVNKCVTQCPVTTFQCLTVSCRKINTLPNKHGPTDSNVEIEYGVGGCAGNCPANTPECTDNACNPTTGDCGTSTNLSRCEQKKWKQAMEWNFAIDMPNMLSTPDPLGSRKFICVPNPNMANYTELPTSFNTVTGLPDPNNIKTAKTVSPAVEVNLSLPAKN